MPRKRKVGNPLALAVLSYLTQRPMHPYELSRSLRQNGDERSIKFNHGSLYMVVGQLAKAGFIIEHEVVRDGQRPERTVYALTDSGRDELRNWLRELIAEPEHEYPRFVAALALIGTLTPGEVCALLAARMRRLGERRAEALEVIEQARASNVHPLFLVEEDYRLALLDAEATFVERLNDRISNDPAWIEPWQAFHNAPR